MRFYSHCLLLLAFVPSLLASPTGPVARELPKNYASYGDYGNYGQYGSYGAYKRGAGLEKKDTEPEAAPRSLPEDYSSYGDYGNYGRYGSYGAYKA